MPLQRQAILIAALWWGGMSALSFLAVPLLFATLGSPAVAGPMAANIFSLQCWVGLVFGMALLVILRRWRGEGANIAPAALTTMGFVLFAMLLALLQEFAVAQNIVTARASGGNLRLWHGMGTAMVLGQWLCAGAVLWRLSAPRIGQD
ncbi:hypothetical protein ASE11_17185 [Hydrogenophaga sp. Root209]|uniref:DUF4149 domain-containing protein n=1 Tax=unclassified Hydrogenophaga TaxID=2610897 RepID=UPI0006FD15B4|nr:DUF4149 domain-containing protein [Hydrogenophaga sp. Root209]KRB96314.1 hypothetical protein ASE11_17185 [Hydrogenophaga sp. Root209]